MSMRRPAGTGTLPLLVTTTGSWICVPSPEIVAVGSWAIGEITGVRSTNGAATVMVEAVNAALLVSSDSATSSIVSTSTTRR